MPCVPLSFPSSCLLAVLVAAGPTSCAAFPIGAGGRRSVFRPPTIVLVYPASDGGVLPSDRPLVVFRFENGEPNDPIDPGAFRASVDGTDRTSRFSVTPSEAWGRLADSTTTSGLTPGSHVIGARVCSTRGACGSTSAHVDIRPWDQTIPPPPDAR